MAAVSSHNQSPKWFDDDLADRYEAFPQEFIKITEGDFAGQNMEFIPCWRDAIRECMGWRTVKDNRRWYRTLYVYIPRKNAKTTTIAAVVLAIPVIEPESRGQILIAASTEEQAEIMFKMSKSFIEADKVENGGTGFLPSVYHSGAEEIEHIPTGTIIKFISGTKVGKTGSNPSVIIIDEFQEQKNLELLSILKTGSSSRKQPLVIIIGTSGIEDDAEDVPWIRMLKLAKAIKENPDKQPRFLPMIYEALETDDVNDPAVWYKANPGLGIAQDEDSFAEEWNEAKDDPVTRQQFLQYHLNIRRTMASEFIDLDLWNVLYDPKLKISQFRGKKAYGGLDLSLNSDMCAFHLLFPMWSSVTVINSDGKKTKVMVPKQARFVFYWVSKKALEESKKTKISYQPWVDDGLIELAGDIDVDLDYVQLRMVAILKKFKIQLQDLGYDRYQAKGLVTALAKKHRIKCTMVNQFPKILHAPTVSFKNRIYAGDIVHDGNPVFLHNLRNARVSVDKSGYQMADKRHCKGRIDGVAAGINAELVFNDAPPPPPDLQIY